MDRDQQAGLVRISRLTRIGPCVTVARPDCQTQQDYNTKKPFQYGWSVPIHDGCILSVL
ncbi:Hypothetical protein GbCGDNIH4_5008 [Granulibacter bethesdensis CGDNIH4]|nr:Hypothetical protein GbCGDNIH4_5008 [Granulibacter bethesdensis CGDNIH4]